MRTADLVRQYRHIFNTDYTVDANCMGAWLFTEGSGTTVADASGEGNTASSVDGTYNVWVTDDVPFHVSGASPNSMFAGIAIPQSGIDCANFSFNDTSVSVCAWAKPYSSLSGSRQIITKGYDGKTAWGLSLADATGHINFGSFDGSTGYGVTSTEIISNSEFKHVAGTVTGTSWKCYVNGVEASATQAKGVQITTKQVVIGAVQINAARGQPFYGYITDVGMFNDVLSSTEINEIYDYGLKPASGSPSSSPSASVSASPSASPSSSASSSPSASPSSSPSASVSSSPSASPSASVSSSTSASVSSSPSTSASPSASISASPSSSPSTSISSSPSVSPSASVSASPSASISGSPSASPSASISASPSASISASPSSSPSGFGDTYTWYDPTNRWFEVVVDGTSVARFKSDGDIDVNGDVNQNAY